MNDNNIIHITNEQDTMQSIFIDGVRQMISDAATDAENESKEKYAAKMKLIESANDMNTQDKLNAMDRNYDQRNHEHWKNILCFAAISLSLVEISHIAVKNVHKILSAA